MKPYIFFFLFIVSCSSLKMKRPEPVLYNSLKEMALFGVWENSNTKLSINCTGSFEYVEMRDGKEFNKDSGGDISALDKVKKEITVSSIFGDSLYSYHVIDENKISIKAGKRAGVVGGLISVANWITFVPDNRDQYLIRKKKFNCDEAPKDLSDVLNQMSDQLQKGKFKQEGNTLIIEDPNAE